MRPYAVLRPGDPAPSIRQRTFSNPSYDLSAAAGRYIVICLFGSASDDQAINALATVKKHRKLFDDDKIAFFGVSLDPSDAATGTIAESIPGIRHFLDHDGLVSKAFGLVPIDAKAGESLSLRRQWVVLDPTMRVRAVFDFEPDGSETKRLVAYLKALPEPRLHIGFEVQAPILVIPNVFEPELCDQLIGLYETKGGEESGFMREVAGKTVAAYDPAHKRRSDHTIEDEALKILLQKRVQRRIVPEIAKVHQFHVTRMERYIVACYDAAVGGHFRAHRDNTTKGTAHRRFAVSINLSKEFEGGEVSFPEYGPKGFKPPVGGAVVFSCSLLHQVSPVTKGKRYCFLPFLYDDAAAAIRERNNAFLDESVGAYRPENKAA